MLVNDEGQAMKFTVLNWRFEFERVFFDERKLAGMYNDAANRWERSIGRMGYLHAYQLLFQQLQRDGALSHMEVGSKVLDTGIGTGALTHALQSIRPDVNVIGVDISPKMLQIARQNLRRSARYHQANIINQPYRTASFDMVMSAHVIEHLCEPLVGIGAFMRVLKPGCPFVLVATKPCPATYVLSLRWNFKPMVQEHVIEMLRVAGGTDIKVMPLTKGRSMTYMSVVYTGIKGVA